MVEKKIPKRGGARRGPYSGKKMTFTTKLTESTMARLTADAKASEMSVSQKGEAAILRGLNAEDDYQRHFAPAMRMFQDRMTLSMPTRDGTADLASWSKGAHKLVSRLAEDLRDAIEIVCAPQDRPRVTEASASTPAAKTHNAPRSPIGPIKRKLDLND